MKHIGEGGRYALLETAGGVLSPGPSGTVQADLYRPLRLPTILVGDSKLGGIATTISAFESLHVRGYDVDSVVLFNDPEWGNFDYLKTYFSKHDISTVALPQPPEKQEDSDKDREALQSYYDSSLRIPAIRDLKDLLNRKHFARISTLTSMPSKADSIIWHPFRQHGIPHNITAIDSAYDDHFQIYNPASDPALKPPTNPTSSGITPLPSTLASTQSLLTPLFDGSASWWTQGLGHGNPSLALTAAHAAGRYGHVMFAHAIHQPALDISYKLLAALKNPRLNRVFFTDNGSTGMEVAVKMALRAACARYGWDPKANDGEKPVEILGLKGSYHGDTIGVMNCSEPSVFNEKVDWHRPWGHWFDPPSLLMNDGVWELEIPTEMDFESKKQKFESLQAIFDFDNRVEDARRYEQHITSTLKRLVHDQGRRFGALILEPVIMGAGGMIFVDPLFQRTLIKTIRTNPQLIAADAIGRVDTQSNALDWSGLPIIADEVFTGLYRLGRASSSSFLSAPSEFSPSTTLPSNKTTNPPTSTSSGPQPTLPTQIAPDISVHAKLLTAGLLPLALTTASESIFNTFLSDSKSDALLHGHSYTAHPVGCMVANRALDEYRRMDMDETAEVNGEGEGGDGMDDGVGAVGNGKSWRAFKKAWSTPRPSPSSMTSAAKAQPQMYSFFPPTLLRQLSQHPSLAGVFALGTVLVLKLSPHSPPSSPTASDPSSPSSSPGSTSGYTSTASASLQVRLLTLLDEEGCGIHSRVLGDVIYFMTSLTTEMEQVERLGRMVLMALDAED